MQFHIPQGHQPLQPLDLWTTNSQKLAHLTNDCKKCIVELEVELSSLRDQLRNSAAQWRSREEYPSLGDGYARAMLRLMQDGASVSSLRLKLSNHLRDADNELRDLTSHLEYADEIIRIVVGRHRPELRQAHVDIAYCVPAMEAVKEKLAALRRLAEQLPDDPNSAFFHPDLEKASVLSTE